jgi:hypothetical protein
MTDQASIEAFATANGLTVKSEFVPWSQSRSFKPNAKPTDRSLNWRVTLERDGRIVLTTDYSAGIGHAPSYKNRWGAGGMTRDKCDAIEYETEKGFAALQRSTAIFKGKPIVPNAADILYSLVTDCDVLSYSTFEEWAETFEEWAETFGYDADSRHVETIYRECLKQALALRNGLGEKLLADLVAAVAGYRGVRHATL